MFKKLFRKPSHASDESISKEVAGNVSDASLEEESAVEFSKLPLAEKSLYKNNKVTFLQSQESRIFSCYEILELWKKDAKSEIYLNQFQQNLNEIVSSARAEEMLQLMSMGKNMNAYIYESMREDVLADRVFFIGMRRQLDALHQEVRSQLSKFNALEENESISDKPQVDTIAPDKSAENLLTDIASAENEKQTYTSDVAYENLQLSSGEVSNDVLEAVDRDSQFIEADVENTGNHPSLNSDTFDEKKSKLKVLIVSLFGSTYAVPNHAVLEIISPKDQHFEISQGKIKYLRNGMESVFCSLSHVLFDTPIALPQSHQVVLRLNVNDNVFALCVDAVDATDSLEIQENFSHKQKVHILTLGQNQAAESIKVLDLESLYIAALNQRDLSSAERSLFDESNAALNSHIPTELIQKPLDKPAELEEIQATSEAVSTDDVSHRVSAQSSVQDVLEKKKMAHGAVSFFDDEDDSETFYDEQEIADAANQELNVLFINSLPEQHEKFKTFVNSAATKMVWKQIDLTSQLESVDALNQYSAIVLDSEQRKAVDMDLLVKIRADRNFRRLPVIVATQLTSDVFKQRAYILGANYVLQKPYTFQQLQDVIEMVALQVTVVDDLYEND